MTTPICAYIYLLLFIAEQFVLYSDRDMFLGREFEEMCAQMYYRGKMFGFVHLYSGQEVCHIHLADVSCVEMGHLTL